MPTAWAAAGLTLTAMKRRPTVVKVSTKTVTPATSSSTQTVVGT